jgi:hypothetical protein
VLHWIGRRRRELHEWRQFKSVTQIRVDELKTGDTLDIVAGHGRCSWCFDCNRCAGVFDAARMENNELSSPTVEKKRPAQHRQYSESLRAHCPSPIVWSKLTRALLELPCRDSLAWSGERNNCGKGTAPVPVWLRLIVIRVEQDRVRHLV